MASTASWASHSARAVAWTTPRGASDGSAGPSPDPSTRTGSPWRISSSSIDPGFYRAARWETSSWPRCPASRARDRIVFVHGALDRSTAFVPAFRRLRGCELVRYDRRGYGRSRSAGVCADLGEQVDDLATVVAGHPSVVVGHSLGGVLALAFADRHPDLARAVVAYEAPMAWTDWWPSTTAGGAAVGGSGSPADAAERFMRRLVGDERWEALSPRTQAERRAEGPALVAELQAMRADASAPYAADALSMPVLAAHGSESRAHHQEAARRLADAAPHGELAVIEGAGHGGHLTHPAGFADVVRRAVTRAGDRAPR